MAMIHIQPLNFCDLLKLDIFATVYIAVKIHFIIVNVFFTIE